ncbi:Rv3235 family protein [Rhodococcus sp. NPDC003322]
MRTYVTAAPHAEPPTAPEPATRPQAQCARRPDLHAPHRVPHTARTGHRTTGDPAGACVRPDRPAATGADRPDLECRRFAEVTLRMILEVLDHRRQAGALRPLLASTPFDLVTALTRAGAPGRRLGAARLRRVHLHPGGPDRAEVFGSYARGERTFAIAGRLERTAARRRSEEAGGGWVFTALQVG